MAGAFVQISEMARGQKNLATPALGIEQIQLLIIVSLSICALIIHICRFLAY